MKKKILIVSYFYEPYEGIAIKRVKFWHEGFNRHGLDSDVFTSTLSNDVNENISRDSKHMKTLLGRFIKYDASINWYPAVVKYIRRNKDKYSHVILTGSPFLYLVSVIYIRLFTRIKIILDFRDPFSNNPRGELFRSKKIINKFKKKVLNIIERLLTLSAHKLIVMNKFCAELAVCSSSKIEIIDNGFDNIILEKISKNNISDKYFHITYLGSFFKDRCPTSFFKVIENDDFINRVIFHHIGSETNEFKYPKIHRTYGYVDYKKGLEIFSHHHLGIIFTSGNDFESTSKIFDYIGMKKSILIITNGEKYNGNLHEITKGYPSIFWSRNYGPEIRDVLNKIMESESNIFEYSTYPFSREAGLEKLSQLIKDLK